MTADGPQSFLPGGCSLECHLGGLLIKKETQVFSGKQQKVISRGIHNYRGQAYALLDKYNFSLVTLISAISLR